MPQRPLDDDDVPPHDDADMPVSPDAALALADAEAPNDAELAVMPRAWLRNYMTSGAYDVVAVDSQRVIVPPRPTRDAAEGLALVMGFRPYRYAITIPDEAHMLAHRTSAGTAGDGITAATRRGMLWQEEATS